MFPEPEQTQHLKSVFCYLCLLLKSFSLSVQSPAVSFVIFSCFWRVPLVICAFSWKVFHYLCTHLKCLSLYPHTPEECLLLSVLVHSPEKFLVICALTWSIYHCILLLLKSVFCYLCSLLKSVFCYLCLLLKSFYYLCTLLQCLLLSTHAPEECFLLSVPPPEKFFISCALSWSVFHHLLMLLKTLLLSVCPIEVSFVTWHSPQECLS